METTLNDIPMMCIVADGGPEGAREAFNRVESKLPSLRGRKFYGTFHPTTGEYRACVACVPGDEPARRGLAVGVSCGGHYFQRNVKMWGLMTGVRGPRSE